MKIKIALLAMTTTGFVHANTVSTILDINYSDYGIADTTSVSATHYFKAKALRGPLDQFSFINSSSFVGVSYEDLEFSNKTKLKGTWHSNNGLFVGVDYRYQDFDMGSSYDETSSTIGYQSNKVWSVSATFSDPEGAESRTSFNARYEYALGANDWLAFSYSTDDDFDSQTINTRYFNTLENGGYYTLSAAFLMANDFDDEWAIGGQYYWNNYTSASVSFDDDTYSIGAQHYFNDTWALSASYTDLDSPDDDNMWRINLRAQF